MQADFKDLVNINFIHIFEINVPDSQCIKKEKSDLFFFTKGLNEINV